jgi:hypothetical protein
MIMHLTQKAVKSNLMPVILSKRSWWPLGFILWIVVSNRIEFFASHIWIQIAASIGILLAMIAVEISIRTWIRSRS